MITHVAIWYNDTIYALPAPNRHADVIRMISGIDGEDIQGFLDDEGNFLDREAAMIHATACGLVKSRRPGQYNGKELFSEDLW
jgi:hypothetical protein